MWKWVYIKQDGKTMTTEYDEAGKWTLEEAGKVMINNGSGKDWGIICDASNMWLIVVLP